jgi:alpha-galactosidase
MSQATSVTVIGAGSAVFSLGLVKDLSLTESLAGSHVTFMDIDEERLEVVEKLARRYTEELGVDMSFESTTDRRASLQDADFVINTASVVSHEASIRRKHLAQEYGFYYGRVDAGAYGFYNIRFMMDVAHDMEEVCPDAWLIQSGNPVFDGCTMMTRETDLNVIGLCHGHYGFKDICDIIGLDWQKVTWLAPGTNHNIWLLKFLYEGEDAYPLVDEWIQEQGEDYWTMETPTLPISPERAKSWTPELRRAWEIDLSRGAVHMYKMFGYLPIGDTPRRGGWWYHADFDAKQHWFGKPWGGQDTHASWPLYVENLERRIQQMHDLVDDPSASVSEAVGTVKTTEQQVPIIDALVNNNEGEFQVNVPNNGAIADIADDVVVEVPARINKMGVFPLQIGHLPPKIYLEQIAPDVLNMERMLQAIKTGDRSMLLWRLLDNPLVGSYQEALSFLTDYLALQGHEEMDDYFEWPETWDL